MAAAALSPQNLRYPQWQGEYLFLLLISTSSVSVSPSSVPKLTNGVTLHEVWCTSATVSDWNYVVSHRRRELLNRYTG
jgi:hypothetical protein